MSLNSKQNSHKSTFNSSHRRQIACMYSETQLKCNKETKRSPSASKKSQQSSERKHLENGSKVHDKENHNFLEAKRLLLTPDKLWTGSESI